MSQQVLSAPSFNPRPATTTAFNVLIAISVGHLINDMLQSLLPSIYPILEQSHGINDIQLGIITLVYQVTASLLQPLIGRFADKRPTPMALPAGTLFSLAGLCILSVAHTFLLLLAGACLLGVASSIFHPEASRVARMAAGTMPGRAQSIFQVGGNLGSALGPLLAAIVIIRYGQTSLAFIALLALFSTVLLYGVARWYRSTGLENLNAAKRRPATHVAVPRAKVTAGITILLVLIFSKYFYLASITNYLTIYMIRHFGESIQNAQFHLFTFTAAVALGTIAGGPIGDRFGRKYVIWFSILGVLPFTLLLPHVSEFWIAPLLAVIGVIIASAFPAIVVYAQDLMPDNVGTVSGLFFGFAFGMAGVAAAVLGALIYYTNIQLVYEICSVLPVIGVFAGMLPKIERTPAPATAA